MGTPYDHLNKPDYTKYTLDELYDARSHIDDVAYPERAAEIDGQIAHRLKESGSVDVPEAPMLRPEHFGLSRRVLGIYLVVAGIWTIVRGVDAGIRITGTPGIVALVIFVAIYGGMVAGGLSVLRGWRVGLVVSLFAMAMQIPFLRLWRVAYSLSAAPSFEWKLWPRFGPELSTGRVFSIFLFDTTQSLYLGLNVPALVITWASGASRGSVAESSATRSDQQAVNATAADVYAWVGR